MKPTKKTEKLDEYIFSKLENIKTNLAGQGLDVIDLSIGDPDLPTPDFIIKEMIAALEDKNNFKYPPYRGIDEFRIQVANHYQKKYGVMLDYKTEVAALIGSKEGIAHLVLALTEKNDSIIIPDLAYPVYKAAAIICDCKYYTVELNKKRNYLPDLNQIENSILKSTKLFIINYPNNPTGAVANYHFFNELVDFGISNDIVIANDGAYMDIQNQNEIPMSILQIKNAKKICVEFGTLSKAYNMAGWRLGYIVGNQTVIDKLMKIKTNFDSGQFKAIQRAGAEALRYGELSVSETNQIYTKRRILINNALQKINLKVFHSAATFYIWFEVPSNYTSSEFCEKLLYETGILITPGSAFGNSGEGYCRISLTASTEKLIEASSRIEKCSL